MQDGLIRVTPDRQRAQSIFKMAKTSLEMVESLDAEKFSSHIVKEYYEILRELLSILLLLDGYKTYGQGAHKNIIVYVAKNYSSLFSEYYIYFIDELRILRNKITYDGYFVPYDFVRRKKGDIQALVRMLLGVIQKKL